LNYFYVAYLAITMFLCVLMGLRMLTLEENFKLTGEFKLIAMISVYLIIFLLLQVNTSYRSTTYEDVMIQPWLLSFVPCLFFQLVRLYRPVYYSYQEELLNDFSANRRTTIASSSTNPGMDPSSRASPDLEVNPTASKAVKSTKDYRAEFEKILQSEEGIESFKKFLVKEFAVENILFYLSVKKFKMYFADEPDDTIVRAHAKRIYNEYISLTATWSVNISSECKRRIEKNLRVQGGGDGFMSTPITLDKKQSFRELTFKDLNQIEIGRMMTRSQTIDDQPTVAKTGTEAENSVSNKANASMALPSMDPSALPSLDAANLSDKQANSIARVNLFDEAQQEIFLLMLKDSFRRYYQDPEYKNLKLRLQHQKAQEDQKLEGISLEVPAASPLSPEALNLAQGLPPSRGIPLTSVAVGSTIPEENDDGPARPSALN
jgi:hypothetical protein